MATSLPPVRGSAYTTYISLVSQADSDIFQKTVTLAAGDVKVSKDGGGEANIAVLPVEIGTSGVLSVALSGTEMTADTVTVRFCDAAGNEWCDALIVIHTCAQTFDTIDANVDAILEDTGTTLPTTLATIDGIVDAILADTGTDGVTVQELKAAALADLFNTDSGTDYASSVAGSAVKEIADNAGGAGLTLADIADAVLDEAVEGAYTLRQLVRLMVAVLAGKSDGGGTTTVTFRDLADSIDRVTATVDSAGNRDAVSLDVS